MAGSWRITRHRRHGWIIQAGAARCLVRPDLGRALLPLQGHRPDQDAVYRRLAAAGWADEPQGEPARSMARELVRILAGSGHGACHRSGRPALWLRRPLIPAGIVRRLAGGLAPLTATPVLGAQALLGVGLYLVAGAGAELRRPTDSAELAAGLLLFFLLGLWHELGHAAALRREGYPPGGIGLGILFVIPVLYADVTAVAGLPRRGRLRVDLAGVGFQLAAGGLLFAAGAMTPKLPGHGALQLAGLLTIPAVVWSLLPFIRADGYWAVADLLDLADLEQPVPRRRSRRVRGLVVLHRMINALFLLMVGLVLPWRLYRCLAQWAESAGVPPQAVQVLVVALAVLAWWGLVSRLVLLWSACREDVRRW